MKLINLSILLVLFSLQSVAKASELYQVDAGDFLEVSVWKEEGLEKQIMVRPDGYFTFPLAGEIEAKGKSVEAIKQELVSKLSKFIPEPEVNVSLVQMSSSRVYVIGKVNSPGPIAMNHEMNILQALSAAGGTALFAKINNIQVLRTDNDVLKAIPFRYSDMEKGENLEQNIMLQRGDVIVVP